MKHPLASIPLLVLIMAAGSAAAESLPTLSAALYAADENAAAGDEPYRSGRAALDQSRWAEAANLFAESAGSGSSHADAAHYWQAYALHKDGRSSDALEILAKLHQAYAGSSWLDDARALEFEIQGRSGRSGRERSAERAGSGSGTPPNDDEELKLLALNSLMHNDSERAMPMLRKFLAGNHSNALRERALFVLSQSDSSEGTEILLEIARGNQYPELQSRAVYYLGLSGVAGATAALEEIYRSATDTEIKMRVLHSFMLSDSQAPLLQVARTESNEDLRSNAIHQLGLIGATQALQQLYDAESSTDVKKRILHSLFLADDDTTLMNVARTESNESLRRSAIRSLGLIDSDAATTALLEIYNDSQDNETRGEIINALFLSDDAGELIQIARTESVPELRKEAFDRLALMDSEEAVDFMMEILEQP